MQTLRIAAFACIVAVAAGEIVSTLSSEAALKSLNILSKPNGSGLLFHRDPKAAPDLPLHL